MQGIDIMVRTRRSFEEGSTVILNEMGVAFMEKAFPGAGAFVVVGHPIQGRYLIEHLPDGRRGIVPEVFLALREAPGAGPGPVEGGPPEAPIDHA